MSLSSRIKGFSLPVLIIAILLFLASIVAIWFAINASDEHLNPQVRGVLDARHDSVAPQNNMFFAYLAFDSQSDTDINKQGQELYASYLKAHQDNPDVPFDFDKASEFARQPFAGSKDALCGRGGHHEDCVERAVTYPEELQRLVTDNRLLLDRYKSVSVYTHLQNPIALDGNSLTASWAPFMCGKRLFLTEIAVEISRGKIDAGIAKLRDDLAFTRRMLAEPDILLIDKMVLAASTRASLGFISDLLRNRTLSDVQCVELSALVAPLSDAERSLATVFAREFVPFEKIIRDITYPKNAAHSASIGGDKQPMQTLTEYQKSFFIRYNATLNFAWSFVEDKQKASQASCLDYLANKVQIEKRLKIVATDYIYNPIGKILAKVAAPAGLQYIQSMCDLDAMHRIVALQLLIHSQHARNEDIVDFVQHAGPKYANPFTGEPMQLDVGKRSITLQPVAPRDVNYFPWSI